MSHEERQIDVRRCNVCGAVYEHANSRVRFCSEACRIEQRRVQKVESSQRARDGTPTKSRRRKVPDPAPVAPNDADSMTVLMPGEFATRKVSRDEYDRMVREQIGRKR